MDFEMPIEQTAQRLDTRFQLGFANQARTLLRESDEFVLRPAHVGLRVLARNEEALEAPVETLRDLYGEKLRLLPPRVRLMEGVQVREPIMHVRITVPERFRMAIKDAMRARRIGLEEEYLRTSWCVLRYEGPLARLLGLSAELAMRSGSTAQARVALSHYALVIGDPGGAAA